jgi:hypothetical protein
VGPVGVASDTSGNVYIGEYPSGGIYKIDATTHALSSYLTTACGISLSHDQFIITDSSNNLYISDQGSNKVVIWSIPSSSCVATYNVTQPFALALDGSGNLYIGSNGANAVYKVAAGAATGTTATLLFSGPKVTGMAFAPVTNAGLTVNDLLVSDYSSGNVYDYTASSGYSSRTTLISGLTNPFGLFFDSSHNLMVACSGTNEVRKYAQPNYTSYTQAMNNTVGAEGIGIDPSDNIYLTSYLGSTVTELSWTLLPQNVGTASSSYNATFQIPAGATIGSFNVVSQGYSNLEFNTAASGSTCTTGTYATATACVVAFTFTPAYPGRRFGAILVEDSSGNILDRAFVSGLGLGPVLQFQPGITSTIAGSGVTCAGSSCGSGGAASSIKLRDSNSIVLDAAGNTYIADIGSSVIWKITPSGAATIIAGQENSVCTSPTSACGDNGPATSAQLNSPSKLAIDGAGNLYISDKGDNRIRVVNLNSGVISAFAGTGAVCSTPSGACGDGGAASSAYLTSPDGLDFDAIGNVYIGDTNDYKIRKVNMSNGVISTIAGTGVQCAGGTCGDGGQATVAQLDYPNELHIDAVGNMYIPDSTMNRVRKINMTTGIISNVAGSGTACSTPTAACGDGGQATSAQMGPVWGIALDPASNLYITDYNDNKIRFVNATSGIINTVIGTGSSCASPTGTCGDGSTGTAANIGGPTCVAFDQAGNIVVCDAHDYKIRKLTFAASSLSFATSPVGSQSSDSPKSVAMVNAGNASLVFPVPGTGSNPSIAAGFSSDASSTCPVVSSSGSSQSLAVNASCVYAFDFIPVAVGTDSGSAVLTDNNLGVSNSNQTISLTGTGIANVTQLAWGTGAAPASSLTAGGNTGIVVVDEENSGGNIATTATDLITLTVTGPSSYSATYTATAVAGVATFDLTLDPLTAAGSYTYTASIVAAPAITPVTAPETVTAAAAASLAGSGSAVSGQSQNIGAGYPYSFKVVVQDTYGNPVSGATVLFSVPALTQPSAILSASSATTDSTGTASVTGTANAFAGGPFSVTATIAGVSGSVVFPVTNNKIAPSVGLTALPATPIVYGSSKTTLSSAVTSSVSSPTGSVTFSNSSSALGSAVPLVSGSGSYASYFAAGSYSFTSAYSGDSNFLATSSAAVPYVVSKAPVTLTASASQTVPALSTTSTLNLTIAGAFAGTGILVPGSAGSNTVSCNFYNSSSALVASTTATVVAGSANSSAACPVPSAVSNTVGSYSITVAFNGDANYLASGSGTNGVGGNSLNFPFAVQPVTPTVGLTALPATPIVYGSSKTTLSSTVTSSAGSPTGSVVFNNSSSALGSAVPLVSGSGSYASYFAAGSYSFTSAYSGDSNFLATSSAAVPYVVSKAPVTLTASASQTVPALSTTSTLNLTIAGAFAGTGILVPGSAGSNTVSCNFYNSSSALVASTTATVVAGSANSSAACPVPSAVSNTVGSYSITVAFNGDANYLASGSGTNGVGGNSLNFPFAVQPVTPTIAWSPSSSATTVVYGTTLSNVLTAAASFKGSSVPGVYSYTASTVGAVTASSMLAPGVYTITVLFTPTDKVTYNTNTAQITYTVIPATPTVVLTSTPNPIFLLNTVGYTATVTGVTNGVTPSGTVTFYDGTVSLGTSTLNASGVASLTTTPQVAGTHSITAVFNVGNTYYNTATSNVLSELVQDFTVAVASTGSGTATVNPGYTATYALVVSPTNGPTFPGVVTLTATGGPAGATITLTPTTAAAGAGATNLTLTVVTAQALVSNRPEGLARKLAPLSLAFLLLPLFGFRRSRKAWQRYLSVLLLLVGGLAATSSLSGCTASPSGYFGQAPKTFTITVTGTAGALTHSTSVTLTIE